MDFGLHLGVRGPAAQPDSLRIIAEESELLGFTHLGISDHIVIAVPVTGMRAKPPKPPSRAPAAPRAALRTGAFRTLRRGAHLPCACEASVREVVPVTGMRAKPPKPQIGRASCRERV